MQFEPNDKLTCVLIYCLHFLIMDSNIIFFCFQVLGPRFMESRKPYELKNVLILYNFLQVVFSAWLFYEVTFLHIL